MVNKSSGKKSLPRGLEKNINIIPISHEAWNVEINLPSTEISTSALPNILKLIKAQVSAKYKFPIGLLTYEDLIRHETHKTGAGLTLKIIRKEAEKGDPAIRFEKKIGEDGLEYNNMLAYLNLFPVRLNGQTVQEEEIWETIKETGINLDYVSKASVANAMDRLRENLEPLFNILIAEGELPSPGEDADIEYLLDFNSKWDGSLMGSRRVGRGETICRKIPVIYGRKPGVDVFGVNIEPRVPKDLILRTGEGVQPSSNINEIRAISPGIPKISAPIRSDSVQDVIYEISIEPLEIINGNKILTITTGDHIEIRGNLKAGSKIVSTGEVIVTGDVEEETSIISSGNILVAGMTKGGYNYSENDIVHDGSVSSSKLMAHGSLRIKGKALNSVLIGDSIYIEEVIGCSITAGTYCEIDSIAPDENGFAAVIRSGKRHHLQKKLEDNKLFIDKSGENLQKFSEILGEEIISEVTPANIARMLMLYAKDLRKKGISNIPTEHKKDLRNLLATIGPLRDLIVEKQKANLEFLNQLEMDEDSASEISIKSAVKDSIHIEIGEKSMEINPQDGPVHIRDESGEIRKI